MTKKPVFWIVLVVVAALVVIVAVWGKQYYEARYVGADYYTMIPLDYDMTQKPRYSMKGEDVGTGIEYKLTAYNEQGEPRQISFIVYSEESGLSSGVKQPQPGTYLRVSASKQLVVGWGVIEENEVPTAALEKIKKNN